MMRTATWATAVTALAWASSVRAHHSFLSYQTTPLWIEGSVVGFEHVNPHTRITLEERSADGQVRLWAVEGPGQAELDRRGTGFHVPQVGDRLKFCAFAYKSAAELSRIWPGVDFSTERWSRVIDGSSPRFVAGNVMVTSDGKRQLWEPHGVLGECIRSSDDPRGAWLDFLDSSPGVLQAWCIQRRDWSVIRLDESLAEFVEEINRSLPKPCE